MKLAAVLPDMHVPYHDDLSLQLVESILSTLTLDKIIQVGDFIDGYPISRYQKKPGLNTGDALQCELDSGREILERWVQLSDKVVLLKGNHESRLESYLERNAPGLYGLRSLTIPKLLDTDSLGVDYRANIYLGKLLVCHGHEVSYRGRAESGQTARVTMERLNCPVMMGHVHRLGMYTRTTMAVGMQDGYELGCLMDFNQVDYMAHPNWQQGFAIVSYEDNGAKEYSVEMVPIQGFYSKNYRSAIFRGTKYSVTG